MYLRLTRLTGFIKIDNLVRFYPGFIVINLLLLFTIMIYYAATTTTIIIAHGRVGELEVVSSVLLKPIILWFYFIT